ncbi:MAG TPA: SDR family oxidoreductase, partial [Terriglobales bacterium]|nr:SDR family oxidoreductase [Terriglobales bacterium]
MARKSRFSRRESSDNPVSLRGKVAVVTGASRGIGLAIAQALADAGCQVALAARFHDARQIHALQQKLGAFTQSCDVRDERSVSAFFAAVNERFGRVDVLVNNAGIGGPNRNVAQLSLADWREVVETNLTGMFLCTRAALPLMKRGASIVNNLSLSAKRVFPGMSAYNASKHGAAGLTNTLREELRGLGIRVIGLYPGATDTAIWEQFWPEAPRRRMISPETIARAVVFALSLPPEATVEELVIAP